MRHSRFLILFLAVCVFQTSVFGQAYRDNIDSLINKLSWKSITMDCIATELEFTHQDSTELQLVRIGKSATQKLMAALDDSNKTVIVHMILTGIWGGRNEKYDIATIYIYKDCSQLAGWHYIYNGLAWDWTGKTDYIKHSEIQKIKKYWTEKLVENKSVAFDIEKIVKDLERQDKEQFPCNKIYENNSESVKYKELYDLLGKKSEDLIFKKLWNKFGNDSTIHIFDDCFYISYGSEGLSFRFENDSTLGTIFVENSYKGELPYNLKLTDLKPKVENKIGTPFKSGKYSDNTWGWYKDKYLYLDFDNKGDIIKFAISKI